MHARECCAAHVVPLAMQVTEIPNILADYPKIMSAETYEQSSVDEIREAFKLDTSRLYAG